MEATEPRAPTMIDRVEDLQKQVAELRQRICELGDGHDSHDIRIRRTEAELGLLPREDRP